MDKNKWYRSIPKVDVLLENKAIMDMIEAYGRESVMEAIHIQTDQLRAFIANSDAEEQIKESIELLPDKIEICAAKMHQPNMTMVINGTGTILHTNLGRAPISKAHMERIWALVSEYSNLEYNLAEGKRGERYSHFEQLLCKITGAEAAMAVNNNAASVLLILSTLAKGGEAIVSRGELIEIGGKFRIPDVMEQSGATLVEVGTTNKTHCEDYEEAITEDTKVMLKVHTSNYRIVGFTKTVGVEELAKLGVKYQVPVIEDLGSGVLLDLEKYGLSHEPTVQESIANGADVVCFSGDKLLGGPQAGIIVGKKEYIERMKKNPLTRAVRIDKFTACALELVLQEYLSEEKAVQNIPVLQMIAKPFEKIEKDAQNLCEMLQRADLPAKITTQVCESQIGGGSLPLERLPSMAVVIEPENISVSKLEERMRHLPVPVIVRIENDRVLMDVRTIGTKHHELIADQMKEMNVLEISSPYIEG